MHSGTENAKHFQPLAPLGDVLGECTDLDQRPREAPDGCRAEVAKLRLNFGPELWEMEWRNAQVGLQVHEVGGEVLCRQ